MKHFLERYRARGRYFAAGRQAGEALALLPATSGPAGRMNRLGELSALVRMMGQNAYGFRRAATRDEYGFTLADTCERAAWLVELVADTETALVFGPQVDSAATVLFALRVNPAAGVVLAQLRVELRPMARGVLVLALYDAVVDQVGGQAAEALPAIATAYFQLAGMTYRDAARRAWNGGGSR